MTDLTVQQKLFCQKYIECKGNASEAYRQSYNCKESSPQVIWNEASILLHNHEVSVRIQELQAEFSEELKYTVRDAFAELQDAIEFAKKHGQAAPVIAAIKAKIDMFGLDAPKKINIEGTFAEWLNSVQNGKVDNATQE